MPIPPTAPRLRVDFWRAFGHSWLQYQTGPSGDQTGRFDALFRSAMDVEYNSWRNYGSSGARVIGNTRSLGGWNKILQRVKPPAGRVGPYAPDGGGTLLVYGINDLNIYGGNLPNTRLAAVSAHRSMISWARASRYYLTTDAVFAYGAGWTSNASGLDNGMGTVDRLCSTTTAATITFTIPADFKGEPVCFGFLNGADSTGATMTWSGTAMASHPLNGTTFSTSNGVEAAFSTFGYITQRVTGLTSANAGQTIIITCTARDGGGTGSGFFDGAWLESLTPPPVIVCNVARPTTTGYATLAAFTTKWTSADSALESAHDANVVSYNSALLTMTQEFDGMVQVADCDAVVGKDAASFSDGIHPNEYGSGRLVDATVAAWGRMTPPVTATAASICFNPPSPRVASRRQPRVASNWYTSDCDNFNGTYTPVAGNQVAIPFEITEAREQFNQLCMEVTTAGTVSSTLRWGIYEDVNYDGYPGELLAGMDISSAGAFTVALSAGVKTSSTFTTTLVPDPGLYWLVMKIEAAGTGQVYRALTGPSPLMPRLSTTGLSVANGYMGWLLTGIATGGLTGSFPTGATLIAQPPMIGIKKSK
jgi:hypothetical protein